MDVVILSQTPLPFLLYKLGIRVSILINLDRLCSNGSLRLCPFSWKLKWIIIYVDFLLAFIFFPHFSLLMSFDHFLLYDTHSSVTTYESLVTSDMIFQFACLSLNLNQRLHKSLQTNVTSFWHQNGQAYEPTSI